MKHSQVCTSVDFEPYSHCISCAASRNKRLRGSMQSASAITAALLSEDEDDSDDLSDDPTEEQSYEGEADNPRWQLYNAVRTCTNAQGEFHCH